MKPSLSHLRSIAYLLDKEGLNVSYGEIVDMFQKIYWNNGEGLINNENIIDITKNIMQLFRTSLSDGMELILRRGV